MASSVLLNGQSIRQFRHREDEPCGTENVARENRDGSMAYAYALVSERHSAVSADMTWRWTREEYQKHSRSSTTAIRTEDSNTRRHGSLDGASVDYQYRPCSQAVQSTEKSAVWGNLSCSKVSQARARLCVAMRRLWGKRAGTQATEKKTNTGRE